MKLSSFDYDLPKDFIAQRPAQPRDSSKMLVLQGENIEHRKFLELPYLLEEGDLLVLNNTKVIKARIYGQKETGGKIELLVLSYEGKRANCLVGGKAKEDVKITFENSSATIKQRVHEGEWVVEFEKEVEALMRGEGVMPTPPYIKKDIEKDGEYQTIYAEKEGSIAAPTAGLHFTERVFDELEKKGVNTCFVMLHVGLGTFAPVKEGEIEEHEMHSEYFEISEEVADLINKTKESGKRVIIVGTTTMRAIESSTENGKVVPKSAWADIFIYPGYEFKFKSDGLLTNFHLPKSTLLMLVSAYIGREKILKAYEEAKRDNYRFYSFGDCMLCLK